MCICMDWYGKEISDVVFNEIHELIFMAYKRNHANEMKKTQQFEIVDERLRELLQCLYDEFGIKTIVKLINDQSISYSIIRRILKDLKIEISSRTCTDDLKRVRSINAIKHGNFDDWTTKFHQRKERGIQGYFLTKNNDYVWLRSSYEFFYAKFLDENNIEWKYEERSYMLKDGSTYRPDFFIYEDGKLSKIIEVKGTYFFTAQNRIDKANLVAKEFDLKIIILTQNELNQLGNLSAASYEWKKVRRLVKSEEQ